MYYLINIHTGGILGPTDNIDECEDQYKLLEHPSEWILVKAVGKVGE